MSPDVVTHLEAIHRQLNTHLKRQMEDILQTSLPPEPHDGTFTLESADLGTNLISRLERLMGYDRFSSQITIHFQFDWGLLAYAIASKPPIDASSFAVVHREFHNSEQPGVSHLHVDPKAEFQAPDLTQNIEPPGNIELLLNEILDNRPFRTIPYYVGPIPHSQLDSLFPSGNLAQKLHSDAAEVPGVTTLYGHWGERGSGTPFHCEDAQVRSYNLNVFGFKLWILISTDHTFKFESLVQQLFPCELKCDQSVRHASLLIRPDRLRKEGIDFDLLCARPGIMVVTKPRQYHAVINLTTSFAIATNFILPGEEAIPLDLLVCKQDGLYGLRNVNIAIVKEPERQLPKSKKRKAPPHPTKGAKKRATPSSFEASDDESSDNESSDNLEAARSNALDDGCEVSGDEALVDLEVVGSDVSDDEVLEDSEVAGSMASNDSGLAAARPEGSGRVQAYLDRMDRMEAMGWEVIRTPEAVAESEVPEVVAESEVTGSDSNGLESQPVNGANIKLLAIKTRDCQAVLHFTTIVRQWRAMNTSVETHIKSIAAQTDITTRAAGWLQLASSLEERSSLFRLLSTIITIRLVTELDSQLQRQGRERIDRDVIGRILKARGEQNIPKTRKRFHNQRQHARKIIAFRGKYEGLLCFIPVEHLNDYCSLPPESIPELHNFLDDKTTTLLCKVGKSFEDSIWTGSTFHLRRFETRTQDELSSLSLEVLITLLAPCPDMDESTCTFPDLGWPRPEDWPEAWPWPTRPDYLPPNTQCDVCSFGNCQCIKTCFPPEPDVQVCGAKGLGLVARIGYEKSTRIGQLVGHIGRPNQYADGWAFDFRRSDLDCEPDVGQIYCRDEGNCFKLLNHSCGQAANAGVRIERISGKARVVIFALRKILQG